MAHKKGQGSSRNGRDSNPQRLGIKLFGGQFAKPGSIICRQRGTKWRRGKNVGLGRDYTIYSLVEGIVYFDQCGRRINVAVSEPLIPVSASPSRAIRPQPSVARTGDRSTSTPPTREVVKRPLSIAGVETDEASVGLGLLGMLRRKGTDAMPTSNDLAIRCVAGRTMPADDFGAIVATSGTELEVPETMGNALIALHIATASSFISYVQSSPSSIANKLGWTVDQVRTALPILIERLRGHVPNEFLSPPPVRRFSYGAIIPEKVEL